MNSARLLSKLPKASGRNGSAARGNDREDSDVDLLVDFAPETDILDIIGIQHELEDLLGVLVDLVCRSGLKERVRARAAKDLLPL